MKNYQLIGLKIIVGLAIPVSIVIASDDNVQPALIGPMRKIA